MAQQPRATFPLLPTRAHGLNNLVKATIVNADSARHNTVCRYHTSNSGNICVFGTSCHYLHFAYLDRPRAHAQSGPKQPSEETQATLKAIESDVMELRERLSTIENLLQPKAAAQTQHVDDLKFNGEDTLSVEAKSQQSTVTKASGATPVQSNLAGNDEQSDALDHALCEFAEPANTHTAKTSIEEVKLDNERKHDLDFEKQIEIKVDTRDTHKDFTQAKVDTASAARTLDAKKEEKLWTALLCNNPQALIAKYPKLHKKYFKLQCIGKMDAIIIKLKKQELNRKAVIIHGRVSDRGRFIVELYNGSKTTEKMRIKDENLQTLSPLPTREAFSSFKDDIVEGSWNMLTLGDSCFHNDQILNIFLQNQFHFNDGDVDDNPKLKKLCTDTVRMAKAKGLGVTRDDCPKIISLLYCLAFHRKVHVVHLFEIPSTWTPQLWTSDTDLFVLLPPSG